MRSTILTLMVALTISTVAIPVFADDAPARGELGRSAKLRILVDKTMHGWGGETPDGTSDAGYQTHQWMLKHAAEAGFNIYSPRIGHEKLDKVRTIAGWAENQDIYYMPFMRGSLEAPDGHEADGKRMVWASGAESPLWSPNSEEFRNWFDKHIIAYAKISAKNEHLMGVFLDYENYSKKGPYCYSLSYDRVVMQRFAEAQSIDMPTLAPDQRKTWLEEQGLHEAFEKFQVEDWREHLRKLRNKVDHYNPDFQFCIYPAPNATPYIRRACYPEMTTKQAPLIIADPSTYGRPSSFLHEAQAVHMNREKLQARMQLPELDDVPHMYAGGIDPAVHGADAEFSGKNAVVISDVTDGYWVFYEGVGYKDRHLQYFKWFTWANRAIEAGNFEAQYAERETPEDFSLPVQQAVQELDLTRLEAPEVTNEVIEYPEVRMRFLHILVIGAKAGKTVEIKARNIPLTIYRSLLVWQAHDPSLDQVASGQIAHDSEGVIRFTPKRDGIYVVGLSAGTCNFSLVSANVPVGVYAAAPQQLRLIGGFERAYFHVPKGIEQFEVFMIGKRLNLSRLNAYNPEQELIASGENSVGQPTATIQISTGQHDGKIWSLQVTEAKAREGRFGKNRTRLGSKLPPVLSFSPEHVFRLRTSD